MERLRRDSTLRFSFPQGAKLASEKEVCAFATKSGLKIKFVEAIYLVESEHAFMIKYKDDEIKTSAAKYLKENKVTFEYENGANVELIVTDAAKECKYVRIFDLPYELPMEAVETELAKYGKIAFMTRERHPTEYGFQVCSATRGFLIEMEREIPLYLNIQGHRGRIQYASGQKERCFWCGDDKQPSKRLNSSTVIANGSANETENEAEDENGTKSVENKSSSSESEDGVSRKISKRVEEHEPGEWKIIFKRKKRSLRRSQRIKRCTLGQNPIFLENFPAGNTLKN